MKRRVLQLLISFGLLLIFFAVAIPKTLHLEQLSDFIEFFAMFIVGGIIIWNNLKFDWIHLKLYQFKLSPPKTNWPILIFVFIGVIFWYAGMNVSAMYDSHLSWYDVSVQMPKAWWPEETQWAAVLTLASTAEGIYTLWFYIFTMSLFAAIYSSGIASTATLKVAPTMSWSLIGSRIVLAVFGFIVSIILFRDIGKSLLYILREGNEFPELQLFVNVAPIGLATLNAMVMCFYSIWIFFEGVRAFRVRILALT